MLGREFVDDNDRKSFLIFASQGIVLLPFVALFATHRLPLPFCLEKRDWSLDK